MKDLIEALTILAKYMQNVEWPTHCEHDVLLVACDPDLVSEEDKKRLEELSFEATTRDGDRFFRSYKYGSC